MKWDSHLARLADLLPEPILFLDRAGTIQWCNAPARELLQTNGAQIAGAALSAFVTELPAQVDDYLGRCARAGQFMPGQLTFKTAAGEIACSTEGARLGLVEEIEQDTLVIRLVPREDASRQFLLLNEQISSLHGARRELEREIAKRTQDLTSAQAALRELSARLLQAQDDERRRLARDLHDSTGQLLTAIVLNLSVLSQDAASLPSKMVSRLSETVELANEAIGEIRTMSYLLYPPMLDEAGLEMALQWYVEGFRKRSHIAVTLSLPIGLHRLGRDLELAIFRVVQECLTNIHRHSGSETAAISLSIDDGRLLLLVRDEGRGLPTAGAEGNGHLKHAGVGIRGMRERVRQLEGSIQLEAGHPGTIVRVDLPLSGNVLRR